MNDHRSMRRFAPSFGVAFACVVALTIIACSATGTAPLGAVVANPISLTFPNCALTAMTFSVSQQNFNGTFTAVSNNTALVTVAPTSPPDTFAVTPVASNGMSTTITVTGGGGMTTTVNVQLGSCVCHRYHDMWAAAARR